MNYFKGNIWIIRYWIPVPRTIKIIYYYIPCDVFLFWNYSKNLLPEIALLIKETIGKDLPKGFQTAEFLLEHGFIDLIVERKELKEKLSYIIDIEE